MATTNLTTLNDNKLYGNEINDIDALAGDDTLDGGGGNDILRGNTGFDLIAGGSGNDILWGGNDDDVLDGGTENDTLNGDAGNDILYGGTGTDTLNGGANDDYLFGGSENDKLFGGTGSDAMYGGTGNDTFYDTDNISTYGASNTEIDEMIGGDGDDSFFGGYDVMWGNDGKDTFSVKNKGTVYGGVDNDTITVTNTVATLGSWLDGGLGNDTITGGSGNDTLFSGYGTDKLIGGAGNDSYVLTFDDIYGANGAAVTGVKTITDTGGTDTVYYIRDFAGDDRDDDVGLDGKELDPVLTFDDFYVLMPANIENGVLDDQIYVNNPNKLEYKLAWLTGNTLGNIITGSNLDDILDGGANVVVNGVTTAIADTINAGDGDDVIFAGLGADKINGGAGEDIIAAVASYSLVNGLVSNVEDIDLLDFSIALNATGDSANNILYGNKNNNTLDGGAGDDTLDGWFYSTTYSTVTDKATGSDILKGGAGNDLYRIDSNADLVQEANITTGGIDTVEFKGTIVETNYTLTSGVENLVMKGGLLNGIGNKLSNRIIGDSGKNSLFGDYGDDYLEGGTGADLFNGGYGDDTFVVDSAGELITEQPGQGEDWVQSATISLDLNIAGWGTGGIENAMLTGKTSLDVTGNSINNTLIGNDGDNKLNGNGGTKDTLIGGAGNDLYIIDTTTDILTEASNNGTDTIQSGVNFSLAALLNFENLTLSPNVSATTATGNIFDNYLTGNGNANTMTGLDGNDTFDGGAGADKLIGGKGDDVYKIINDGDVVTELSGEGNDTIEIASTYLLASSANVENLTFTGTNIADGTGTSAVNKIVGNSAANVLTGLDGADRLEGGEGSDTLIGGIGADVIVLTESAAGNDLVKIGATDSPGTTTEADRIIGFKMPNDTLDLAGTIKVTDSATVNGTDAGTVRSHNITKGIIKFDDADTYSPSSPLSITAINIANVIQYLSLNIKDSSSVAFIGTAPNPDSSTSAQVPSTWVFQDNGNNDTLVALLGVTPTSLSTAFGPTAIHLI